ncbi:hypothetical protein [Candidatus Venteria ishoeyi]|uniref:UPF0323 domain-containing protein n=1 Tax=Candidatus Venteria ishoeyi TaxID=1899563 RepID=A0A1H6FHS7_9GAMM|nr:hypothetical protein [Candidatus Venteria ishoeyi]MDM8546602.1 hypothetical protein [Candidatus Venteria ishoeyi]SEH08929.1 Uncharacterised protein [Candidatus Venteria ishoeyi]
MKLTAISPKLSPVIIASLGLSLGLLLSGCGEGQNNQSRSDDGAKIAESVNTQQNFFLVIEQTGVQPDTYKLVEKHPSTGATRAVLRDMQGNEKMLSEAELKQLAEAEAAKVEAGTSRLTQEGTASESLGLGETIMASAAGALIGGMIANKLAGNNNFQQHQQQANQNAAEGNKKALANNQKTQAAEKAKATSKSQKSGSRRGTRRSPRRRR